MSFEFLRHGAEHDQYLIGRQMIAVPRHREINEWTARGILRDVQGIVGREEGA